MDKLSHDEVVKRCTDSRLRGAAKDAKAMGVAKFVPLPDFLDKKNDDIKNWHCTQILIAIAIACKNQPVSIEEYTYIVQTHKPQSRQQQPWHMAEKGLPVYYKCDTLPNTLGVVPPDCYVFYVDDNGDMGAPNAHDRRKTRNRRPDPNFTLDGGCQTCDNPKATDQGHRDYRELLTDENSIRQCHACNGSDKSNVIWGEGERPRPIGYSAAGLRRVVKKSDISAEKRDRILEILKENA